MIGRCIDEKELIYGKNHLNYSEWIQFSAVKLMSEISSHPTFRRLTIDLLAPVQNSNTQKLILESRHLLCFHFLPNYKASTYTQEHSQRKHVNFLADCGYLVEM